VVREILYGRQPVRECLRARRRTLYRLVLAEGVRSSGIVADLVRLAGELSLPIQEVPRNQLNRLEAAHQGVALEVGGYPYVSLGAILDHARRSGEAPFLLALDHVQDVHNLGALLRTAEAVGVHGVIIPERRAASVTPAVVSTSAGASEHMRVTQVVNLVRCLEELKTHGVWVVGLDNCPAAQAYDQVDLSIPLVLLVGAEGEGLSRLARRTCELLIRLPMRGQIGSLNASVAGGVAMYAVLAARRRQTDAPCA
jgi:23S rRNA (guanosine2251-2'-O)-methyltransferase